MGQGSYEGTTGKSSMTKVTVDQTLRSKLLNGQVELCDETGQTLGFFLTAEEYKHLFLELAKLKFSPEELERRFHEPNGHTTAEVLARLNQL